MKQTLATYTTSTIKHICKHKHWYALSTFGMFAVVKTFVLLAGVFGISFFGSSFAAGDELNSTNIVSTYGCATDATTCDLSNINIGSIAEGTFVNHSNLTDLYLNSNQITSIESGDFSGLSNLAYLYLSNNQISSIESDDFSNLPNLTNLDVSINLIDHIDENFSNMIDSVYWTLNVDYNYINYTLLNQALLDFLFSKTGGDGRIGLQIGQPFYCGDNAECKTLVSLYNNTNGSGWNERDGWLSNPNICDWHGVTCDNNYYVTKVDLQWNGLSGKIPSLTGLSNITTLFLGGNTISGVVTGAFVGLSNLDILDLHADGLTNIYSGMFLGLANLRQLWLYNNQIISLSTGAFAGLSNLNTLTIMENCLDPNFISSNMLSYLNTFTFDRSQQFVCLAINYTPTTSTSGSVVGTLVLTGGSSGNRALLSAGNPILPSHTWTENGSYTFDLTSLNDTNRLLKTSNVPKDIIGNVFWINDLTPPVASITYSTTGQNNNFIAATIELNESGVITNNSGSFSHTFTKNGTFLFEFADLAGNTGNILATATGIFACENTTDASTEECEGLVSLYNQTNGENWTNKNNWIGEANTDTVCDWYGITCTNNHVTAINLSNNNLSGILNLEKLPYLVNLNLDHNKITSIENGAFHGLGNLISLNISSNEITQLPIGTFSGLNNITGLNLDYNPIVSIDSGAFLGLDTLTSLSIKKNELNTIDSGMFLGLSELTLLNISSGNISFIESGSFSQLSKLDTLYISFNKIPSIKLGDFAGLSNLTALYVGGNKITSIDSGAFGELHKVLLLTLQANNLTSIEAGDFAGLSSLTHLSLFSNKITIIENNAFDNISSLDMLQLGGNQLTTIDVKDFIGTNLRFLELYSNQITSLESGAFTYLPLRYLDLRYNHISTISSSDFMGLYYLRSLFLSSNPITYIQSGSFSDLSNIEDLQLSPLCNTQGTENIAYPGGFVTTNNNYCVAISSNNTNDFILQLGNRAYLLDNNYYIGTLPISFNAPGATSTFLATIIMQTTKKDDDTGIYYTTHTGEVQYNLGTSVTYNGSPFTGLIHSPVVFATGHVPGMTGVASLMRFGALTHRIDFSQTIIVRIPAVGKNIGDSVAIYSSEKENIYTNNPERTFEKTGTVIDKEGIPYVEFTTTHASRYVLTSNIPNITIIAATNGNGGTPSIHQDICPTIRDCSSSYYDNLCGPCTSTGTTHGSASCDVSKSPYSPEITSAFTYAYDLGITTQCPIAKANLTDEIIRSHFAKMVTEFAIKVLKKTPNTKLACTFADTANESAELKFYIKTACQLGLMGRNADGKTTQKNFNPKDTMTRAQIGTVLSRLLYGNVNNSADNINWFSKHLQALNKSGIMNDISKPYAEEIRGFILLMLQRASK